VSILTNRGKEKATRMDGLGNGVTDTTGKFSRAGLIGV
jgi:hypothetical protein